MRAQDIMTPSPCVCSPSDSLQAVARLMRDNDCGAVPVVEDGCVIGIVTDRDLTVRAVAEGKGPNAHVGTAITLYPWCCAADADVRDVEKIMTDHQVRRVPVVDADGCCVGIVSQADLARAALDTSRVSEREVAVVVERISEPARRSFDRGLRDSFEQRLD